MEWFKRFTFLMLALALAACEHGIDIAGQGVVLAGSDPDRDCSTEQAPCRFFVADAYNESYVAIPDASHVLTGWEGCPTNDSSFCAFDVPADVVEEYYGQKTASLVANFAPVDAGAFDGVWRGTLTRLLETDVVCLSRQDGEIRCHSTGFTTVATSLQVSLRGNGITSGFGGNIANFGDGFVIQPVSVSFGSFVAHQSMDLQLFIDGQAAELNLVFDFYHNIGLPLSQLSGEYDVMASTGPGGTATIRIGESGDYSLDDNSSCEETGSISREEPFHSTYLVSINRTNCSVNNGDFSGYGVVYFDTDELRLMISVQLDGLTVSEGGIMTRFVSL